MAGSGVIGGGFAGSIGSNKFEMSLYNETKATPVFVAGTLSHFTVHFTVGVSRETKMKVEKNGVATGVECTIASGGNTCSDTTHTATFAPSELLVVTGSYSGSNSGTNPTWSATYE